MAWNVDRCALLIRPVPYKWGLTVVFQKYTVIGGMNRYMGYPDQASMIIVYVSRYRLEF